MNPFTSAPRGTAAALGLTLALSLPLAATAPAQAAAVYTTDFAAFNAANPDLAFEDFEAANLAPGGVEFMPGPLNAATNNSVFAAGSVRPGFSLEGSEGGRLYVSRDVGGNSGANISSSLLLENIFIHFAAGVTAVGLDLMQWNGSTGGWRIEAYDASDTLLGAFSVGTDSFVGITAREGIARLLLDKPNSGGVIDNLRFGTAGGTVPLPSSLALAALALLVLRAGLQRRPA